MLIESFLLISKSTCSVRKRKCFGVAQCNVLHVSQSKMTVDLRHYSFNLVEGDFLIDGPNCKILNLSPFDKDAMRIFERDEFEPCSKRRPLTSVEQNFKTDKARLIIHHEHKNEYLAWWQSDIEVCREAK